MDILSNVAKAQANVESIENQLFDVVDFTVPTPKATDLQIHPGTEIEECPVQVVYDSNGRFLGQVKDKYESIQPRDFLETVLNSSRDCGSDLDLSRMTYCEMKDGKLINFRIPSEMVVFKNRTGSTEEIELFLNFETGFGGNGSTQIGIYSHRFRCENGMLVKDAEVELIAKHTKRMNAKVMLWCDEINKVIAKQKEVSQVWQALDRVDISDEQIDQFLKKTIGLPKEHTMAEILSSSDIISTRKMNILTEFKSSLEIELARTGKSAYGLIQGVTHYTNHSASGAGNEYISAARGKTLNDQVQQFAMSLV